MTSEERKQRMRVKRQKQVAKQKMILLLATLFIITVGSIVFGSIFSAAKNPDETILGNKCYKSIIIEHGDSLWDIAKEHCTDNTSVQEYVEELKTLNALTSETIHAGEYLLVTYYDAEMK